MSVYGDTCCQLPVWTASCAAVTKDITLQSDRGGAPFIPMKAAQCCIEAKKAWIPRYKNTRSFLDVGPMECAN